MLCSSGSSPDLGYITYIATIQGGHLGINKTTEKISSRYYWPNIKEDVTSFTHTCEKCKRVNKSMLMKTNIELHPKNIFSSGHRFNVLNRV